MRECVVLRHQLFKASEPFIAEQAQKLSRYHPIYLGRERFGNPPDGAESLVLKDLPKWGFVHAAWQATTRDMRSYMRLLKGRTPVLVHAHFGVEGVYALPLARRLSVPLVTTFHGFDATVSASTLLRSRKPSLVNYVWFRRRLSRRGSLFLCVSKFIRDRVVNLGFPEDRTVVHYLGVDTEAIKPRDPAERASVILHVARLTEVKGTEYLIRAFARTAAGITDAHLVIIGDGPLAGKMKSLTERLNLNERVHFLGERPHEDVLTWMRRATVLVSPSVIADSGATEGLGIVILEAAATGVPVIATRHGGIPEAVIDGETGYLVPGRNIEALAECMARLLEDADKGEQMGANGRALAEKRFDSRRQTQSLETLYDSLIR